MKNSKIEKKTINKNLISCRIRRKKSVSNLYDEYFVTDVSLNDNKMFNFPLFVIPFRCSFANFTIYKDVTYLYGFLSRQCFSVSASMLTASCGVKNHFSPRLSFGRVSRNDWDADDILDHVWVFSAALNNSIAESSISYRYRTVMTNEEII